MSLYKSIFQEIFFDADSSTLENVWSTETEKMAEDDYKHEMLELSRLFLTHEPRCHLIDTQNFLFTISPELQAWTDEFILKPHSEVTWHKKSAFVVSKELFPSVSVEQAMEEEHGADFNLRYFDEREEAITWLRR